MRRKYRDRSPRETLLSHFNELLLVFLLFPSALLEIAVVTLQPHWTEIHSGEKITLRCEIEGGDDSEWEYEWETTSSDRTVRQSESFEITATSYSEGEYKCKGKHKTELLSSTPWSTPITLTVSGKMDLKSTSKQFLGCLCMLRETIIHILTSGRESSQSWMSVKGEWDSQGDTPCPLK
uniref:Ig-like domain-containing protein n=1 Tax=Labrus bergylta TaxID=56723 RepID=A0A3Q3GYP2_9LABR